MELFLDWLTGGLLHSTAAFVICLGIGLLTLVVGLFDKDGDS